jgi:hypothetical protein
LINSLIIGIHLIIYKNSHSASEGKNSLSIIKGSYLMLHKEVLTLRSENLA